MEQEKSGQYRSQIAVYKMLAEQYRQSERLRYDMKNHIIALSALSRNQEWEKIDEPTIRVLQEHLGYAGRVDISKEY